MDLIESTVKKLSSVIELVEKLEDSDFPYDHSKNGLEFIKSELKLRLNALLGISQTSFQPLIKTQCKETLGYVYDVFRLIGFIVRSTDNRNSFELHGPFLRLVNKALGANSKLIISSEWDYSPYTFNSSYFSGMNDFVFIGMPASESLNELTIPLSGHELGHNIWRTNNLDSVFRDLVINKITDHIKNDIFPEYQTVFTEITEKDHVTNIIGQETWSTAWNWSMMQCQEVFCDCIGLLIFRESFLYSFSYLLAPGFPGRRPENYLNVLDRIQSQIAISKMYGVTPPKDYIDIFEDSDEPNIQVHTLLLSISDYVTKSLVNEIATKAQEIVVAKNLDEYSETSVQNIINRFSVGVPIYDNHSLTNILNAAWIFYNDGYHGWKDKYPDIGADRKRCRDMLTELVFKSIEISEVLALTKD